MSRQCHRAIKRSMILRRREERAAMLILAIVLMTLLWFSLLAFSNSTLQALKTSSNYLGSERATTAAEAGLLYGLDLLKADTKWRPTKSPVKMKYSEETFLLEVFEAKVSPTRIPTETLFVRSTGVARSGQKRIVAAVVKLGKTSGGSFDYSLFGEDILLSGGVRAEAFDARTGNAVPGAAHVGSNSVKKGSVRLDSGVTVDGVVSVGETANVTATTNTPGRTWETDNAVWKNWNTTTKGERRLDKAVELPLVSIPAAASNDVNISVNWQGADLKPGSYRNLTAAGGGTARLAGGAYYFSKVDINGGATLAGAGSEPVVIYVREKLTISNGTMSNSSRLPRNLIFVLAPNASVEITGGSSVYSLIYAPQSNITLSGGSRLYGAAVGKNISMTGGFTFYYDVSLREDPPTVPGLGTGGGSGSGGGLSVISWRRY